jgi:hypothetical protein
MIAMDWIQGHLLINHVPVIGTWIGTAVLAWGLFTRKEDVRRLALGLLAIVALSAVPAFFSGSEAEDRAQGLPGVSSAEISEHESAADFALASCTIVGLVAIAALVVSRRRPAVPRAWLVAVLCLALWCSAVLARTAHLGGLIRHPEIRGGFSEPNRS